MFAYRLLLELHGGILGILGRIARLDVWISAVATVAPWYCWCFWYDNMMTETFAYWLLLVLYNCILGIPGILGKIACWRCLFVGWCKLKREVNTLSIRTSGMAR